MNTIKFRIKPLIKNRLHFLIVFILLHFYSHSFATWSIIIIDSETREIGIAGASCTHNCYGIGKIVPNVGAVIVQAMSNRQARDKGIEMIVAESTPEQVIEALKNPIYDPERQQYAVVTIKDIQTPSTYTGNLTNTFHEALTASGVSVQGNTLANESIIKNILEVVLQGQKEKLNIYEILMMALETGSKLGGDKRCGEQTASTAFVTVNKPNKKKPYLNLIIFGQKKGGQNAVNLLRKKYERWKKKYNGNE